MSSVVETTVENAAVDHVVKDKLTEEEKKPPEEEEKNLGEDKKDPGTVLFSRS